MLPTSTTVSYTHLDVYKRQSEESRREALILAALDLVAEGGSQAATVRAIADLSLIHT